MDALVMHAEDATGSPLPEPFQMFIPVRASHVRGFFPDGRRVLLYVYPAGSLIGEAPPTVSPMAYRGSVTMTNVVRDASAEGRPATCRVTDLDRPRIESLPSGTVPAPQGEIGQVVIRFEENGPVELPVFHAAAQHPKMKLGVEYAVIDRDEGDEKAMFIRQEGPHADSSESDQEAIPEYRAPRHLTLQSEIRVPSQDLYPNDIKKLLTRVINGSDLFDGSAVADLNIDEPEQAKVLNRFVYQVNYWLSKETMARVETQMRLFRDT